jgi:RecB family exonuclease
MRREVNAASGLRLEPKEDTLGAERYLFYACVSRAQDRVALSWRSSDEEGNPALPSFFLQDVAEVFDGDLVGSPARTRLLAEVTWPPERAPTPAELARARAARGPRVVPEPVAPLRTAAVLQRLAGAVFSPSALEAYVACPVRWLVDRRLRPNQLAPDAEPLVRGRFFHEVLEGVLTGLERETGSARVTPSTLEAARRIAGEVVEARRESLQLSPHEPTARAEVRRLERDLLRYLDHEAEVAGGWEPAYLEWRFGDDAGGVGVLRLGGGELCVRGTIDRIEIHGDDAIVRDYKASTGHPVARWEPEGLLQVGIYMLAVRELLGKEVVAGLYQPLGRDLRPRGLVQAGRVGGLPAEGFYPNDLLGAGDFADRLADVEQRALEAVRALRSGALAPAPDTCSSRVGCRYPGICRWGAAA